MQKATHIRHHIRHHTGTNLNIATQVTNINYLKKKHEYLIFIFIIDEDFKFKSLHKINTGLLSRKLNYLEYNGIIKSIKAAAKRFNIDIKNKSNILRRPIVPHHMAIIINNNKGCKEFYTIVLNANRSLSDRQTDRQTEDDSNSSAGLRTGGLVALRLSQ